MKSGKQVYLHSASFRETDSYKDLSISFELYICVCKDNAKYPYLASGNEKISFKKMASVAVVAVAVRKTRCEGENRNSQFFNLW